MCFFLGMTEPGLDGNKGPGQHDMMQQKGQNMNPCIPTSGTTHASMQGVPPMRGVVPSMVGVSLFKTIFQKLFMQE